MHGTLLDQSGRLAFALSFLVQDVELFLRFYRREKNLTDNPETLGRFFCLVLYIHFFPFALQFVCGLSLCCGSQANLSRNEIQKIVDHYKTDDGRVQYQDFCDMMENGKDINLSQRVRNKRACTQYSAHCDDPKNGYEGGYVQ